MFKRFLALLLSFTLIAQPAAAAFAHQAEYSSESKTIGVSTGVTGISPSFSPGFSAEDKASSQTLATVLPGAPGKTPFPKDWDANRVMSVTSDLATDPKLLWKPQTGNGGLYTKSGKPARFVVMDTNGKLPVVDGVPVKVIIEPAGEGIITAHPQF